MNVGPLKDQTRRRLLLAVVGGVNLEAFNLKLAALGADATMDEDVLRRYVGLRARLDGRPVFALSRGIDMAIVDGTLVPMRGNLILQATRAIENGDGGWDLPYVETTLVTEPFSFIYRPDWENPLTGERRTLSPPIVSVTTLKMDARGRLLNRLVLPNGLAVDYSGAISSEAGLENAACSQMSWRMRFTPPQGESFDAFARMTLVQTGRGLRGFLPADSMATSLRPKLPAASTGGREASQLSSFYGRKYPSADRLRGTLDARQRAGVAEFFDRWQMMLP